MAAPRHGFHFACSRSLAGPETREPQRDLFRLAWAAAPRPTSAGLANHDSRLANDLAFVMWLYPEVLGTRLPFRGERLLLSLRSSSSARGSEATCLKAGLGGLRLMFANCFNAVDAFEHHIEPTRSGPPQ